MTENWKSVVGYEGLYEVSDQGRVRSLNYRHTGQVRVLRARRNRYGYLQVVLCKDGHVKMFSVHRLVAEAFIPNPQNLPQVNHKDEVKTNNSVGNLEWMSSRDNNNYGTRNRRLTEAQINHPKKSKPVRMFDKSTGELLAVFPSAREAERVTGIVRDCIGRCCNGKYKLAGGYFWQFSEGDAPCA